MQDVFRRNILLRVPDDATKTADAAEAERLASATALVAATESRKNLGRTGRQVANGKYMMPWMRAYAEWLVLENLTPPNLAIRRVNARRLSRQPVTSKHLTDLHARDDFSAYCEELKQGTVEAARAKFVTRFSEYVDAHHEGLQMAREAKDYKAMMYAAEPVINRVYPVKAENPSGAATIIQINLTPEQARGMSATYVAPTLDVSEAEPAIIVDDNASDPADTDA